MQGVEFKQVAKRYGAVSVIEAMDLTVNHGEFMVLVGPSGCGKSTALRMIAGLEEITDGVVTIAGKTVNDLAPKDRDVALVFQNYALYPHMTVRENIDFGLKIRKVPSAERERLVRDAAQVLGIEQLLERRPKELSGGQRQRVALGRAIVRKPAVFLFDEPLSNLDAKLRVQMRAEIKKLQHRLGVTTVYVTHDQIEAMTMGHRIAVMKDGKLQQVGTPIEVYDTPANLFVAQFIGTPPMSFLDAVLSADGRTLEGEGFSVPVQQALVPVTTAKANAKLVVGVRPEHLLENSAGALRLNVKVEVVEPLGDQLLVHGSVAGASVVFKLEPHRTVQMGQELVVSVDATRLHLFDAATEQRLVVPPSHPKGTP
jgi:multiple sugar transport system ATP-binding protein